MKKEALLVIDMLNDFVLPGAPLEVPWARVTMKAVQNFRQSSRRESEAARRSPAPASRRGNLFRILEEARWELDLRGHGHVKFYVSGGIKEEDIPDLNPLVHGYGIGTSISNASVVDFAMDIIEIDGKPFTKRGKWSGSKRVLACGSCGRRTIIPNRHPGGMACACGGDFADLLVPVIDDHKVLVPGIPPAQVREFALNQVKGLEL
jgi:nicotinate phosphoribosyltransferase